MKNNIYEMPPHREDTKAVFYSNRVLLSGETEYHSHDYIEIAFVESGEGTHKVGKEIYTCRKGDIFLINHSVDHMFKPDDDTKMVILNCVFLPEFFDYSLSGSIDFQNLSNIYLFRSFFVDDVSNCIHIGTSGGEYRKIKNLVNDVCNEYEIQKSGYMELIRAYMIQYLIFILRKAQQDNIWHEDLAGVREGNCIITKKVMMYIESHFKDDITVGDLSVMAFLSPAHLRRVFKQTTGYTIKEFMQKIRVETACRMLCDSDRTVGEIANEVGYRDVKYFTELFTKLMGKTPSSFRREKQGKMPQ